MLYFIGMIGIICMFYDGAQYIFLIGLHCIQAIHCPTVYAKRQAYIYIYKIIHVKRSTSISGWTTLEFPFLIFLSATFSPHSFFFAFPLTCMGVLFEDISVNCTTSLKHIVTLLYVSGSTKVPCISCFATVLYQQRHHR